jgi:hypothetical protein
LKTVPSVWDDVKFLDGFPGKFVVLARRAGDRWWLAGINGENSERKLDLDLRELGLREGTPGALIADGDGGNLSFRRETVKLGASRKLEATLPPRGGFVLTFP